MAETKAMTLERWRNVLNDTEESFRVDAEVALALEQHERLERLVERAGCAGYLHTNHKGDLAITKHDGQWRLAKWVAAAIRWEAVSGPYSTIYEALAAADKLEAHSE